MSQEPEKEIEQQLREHAEKRRAEASDQLNLHPATRRLLQDEVTRTYGPSPAAAPTQTAARPWWSYWPGVLFATCCAMLLAIVVMKSGSENESSDYAQAENPAPAAATSFELAATSPQPTASAMPVAMTLSSEKRLEGNLSRSTPNPVPSIALAAQDNRRLLALPEPTAKPAAAKELQLDALADRNSPPPAPRQPRPVSAPAVFSMQPASSGSLATAKAAPEPKLKAMNQPKPVAPAPTPSVQLADEVQMAKKSDFVIAQSNSLQMDTSGVYFATTASGPESTVAGQRFVQTPAREMLRKNYQSPPSPAVLENFQLQQNGDDLKFIDSDGSVYLGSMVTPPTEMESASRARADKDATPARSKLNATGQAASSPRAVGGARPEPPAPRYFRATGMNRTLNQPVVFDGTLEETPTAVFRGGQLAPAKTEAFKQKAQELPQLQIQGRVQIGERQELIINAVPLKP